MSSKRIFIDFDGVIFDTENRVIEMKQQNSNMSWDIFFESLDCFQLLEEAKVINNAIDFRQFFDFIEGLYFPSPYSWRDPNSLNPYEDSLGILI